MDVAETQEAVNDELKKTQKTNFMQLFRNCTSTQKPVYIPMELILNLKKHLSSPCVCDLKKISPKTFGPHCVT